MYSKQFVSRCVFGTCVQLYAELGILCGSGRGQISSLASKYLDVVFYFCLCNILVAEVACSSFGSFFQCRRCAALSWNMLCCNWMQNPSFLQSFESCPNLCPRLSLLCRLVRSKYIVCRNCEGWFGIGPWPLLSMYLMREIIFSFPSFVVTLLCSSLSHTCLSSCSMW